jgi:hypothetical protein
MRCACNYCACYNAAQLWLLHRHGERAYFAVLHAVWKTNPAAELQPTCCPSLTVAVQSRVCNCCSCCDTAYATLHALCYVLCGATTHVRLCCTHLLSFIQSARGEPHTPSSSMLCRLLRIASACSRLQLLFLLRRCLLLTNGHATCLFHMI